MSHLGMDKAKRVGNILWIHKDGRTFALSIDETSLFSKGSSKASISGNIKSPMPGKILKIDVKLGQTVRRGQTICVIEAMKMEYALKAPFDGKIKELSRKTGDQVLLDERVMFLEVVTSES